MADERLRIVIEALNKSAAELKQLQDDLDDVGNKGKKSVPKLGALEKKLLGLMTVAGAVKLARVVDDLADLGAEAERAENSLVNVAGGVEEAALVMDAMRTATRGATDDLSLMQNAASLLALGFGEDADQMGEIARNVEALGSRFGGTMQIFQLMMSNNSLMRIDSFGIGVEEATERIDEFKRAGMDADEAFDTAVLELMNEKFIELGGNLEDNALTAEQAEAAFENLKVAYGGYVDDVVIGLKKAGTPLLNWLTKSITRTSELRDEFGYLGGSVKRLGEVLGHDATDVYPGASQAIQDMANAARSAEADTERWNGLAERAAEQAGQTAPPVYDAATAFDQYNQAIADADAAAIQAIADATNDAGVAAANAQIGFIGAASGLEEMNRQSLAKRMLEDIEGLLDGTEEGALRYAEAQEAILRQFGLLSDAEVSAEGTLERLTQMFLEKKIGPEEYALAVSLLKDKLDGLESKDLTISVDWNVQPPPEYVHRAVGQTRNQRDWMPDEGFATGGFAPVGTTAWVGESGPEIMQVMSGGTMITPVGNSGGGGGTNVSFNIYGATDPSAVASEVKRQLKPYLPAVSMR